MNDTADWKAAGVCVALVVTFLVMCFWGGLWT